METEFKDPASKIYARWITSVHGLRATYREETQDKMSLYYKSKKAAPRYKTGDLAMLNGRDFRTRRATMKLDVKLFGPFRVVKLVAGVECRLSWSCRSNGACIMCSTPRFWNRALAKHLRPPPTAIAERKVDKRCKSNKSFIDRSGVEHEVWYGVDGQ